VVTVVVVILWMVVVVALTIVVAMVLGRDGPAAGGEVEDQATRAIGDLHDR
jgi:uncharacterized membrane protein